MVKFLWHEQRQSHKLRWKTKPEPYFKWRNKYNFLKNIKCPLCKKRQTKLRPSLHFSVSSHSLVAAGSPHREDIQRSFHQESHSDSYTHIYDYRETEPRDSFCCGIHFCKSYAAHKAQNTGFSFTPFFPLLCLTAQTSQAEKTGVSGN